MNRPGFELPPRSWTNFKGFHEEVPNRVQAQGGQFTPGAVQIIMEQGRPLAMSEMFLRDIMAREWRGNVRELRSYLEQAVVMSDGGLLDAEPNPRPPAGEATETNDDIAPLHSILANAERLHIKRAITYCEGSVSKTAEVLGISRKPLWEKMKKLGISA